MSLVFQDESDDLFGYVTGSGGSLRYTLVHPSRERLEKGVDVPFPAPYGNRTVWIPEFDTDDASIHAGVTDLSTSVHVFNCTETLME